MLAATKGISRKTAQIGPHAIHQMLPLLEREGGSKLVAAMLAAAGIPELPPETQGRMPEAPVARLHQAVRAALPDRADAIAYEAGQRTADYIIAHKMPRYVPLILRAMPRATAARLLTRTIQRHAYTFSGSGRFNVLRLSPIRVQIADNPTVRGESSDHNLCHWHVGVFTQLYARLVRADYAATEVTCCANHAPACRFDIAPRATLPRS